MSFSRVWLSPASSSIDEAREQTRERIHGFEMILGGLVGINLCFLPWAFGGVDRWAKEISFALAALSLLVALLPRQMDSRRRLTWVRPKTGTGLIRRPFFWAGLVVFLYVGIQTLNPAYQYLRDDERWWLLQLSPIAWLPAGMRVPQEETNPMEWLLAAASVWLTLCALWAGVTRRRVVHGLLIWVTVNAFFFACFGLIQRGSGATEVYGVRSVGFPYFFAALIYKNHAAAYFGLLSSIALGLAIQFGEDSRRRGDRTGREMIFPLCSSILLLSLLLTFSFSGILLFLVSLGGAVVFVWRQRRKNRRERSPPRWGALIVGLTLVIIFAGFGMAIGFADFREKIRSFWSAEAGDSARMRLLAVHRGLEMARDRWLMGWGAGCFQYGFTKYQAREPELVQVRQLRLRWEHVHNEWLELFIELGFLGILPCLVATGYWVKKLWSLRLWRIPMAVPMLCGLSALAVQATIDFPFRNLAVAATASAVMILLVRLGEIENRRSVLRGESKSAGGGKIQGGSETGA